VSRAPRSRQGQHGGFLLEALIAILIFSFGILGIVGLQAQSIRHINDAQYRAEAIYLANSVVSRMWTDDIATIKANYDSTLGTGAGWLAFKDQVQLMPGGLPGAVLQDPIIEFLAAESVQSETVRVSVFWQEPGETTFHEFRTEAIIGSNRIGPP
jgi:type IV pilus assembly protein PilV